MLYEVITRVIRIRNVKPSYTPRPRVVCGQRKPYIAKAFKLLAFEIFNFSTTEFALTDVLGDLKFAGLRWATISYNFV